jgi:hypothetical protein
MIKLAYKPLSWILGALSGVLAGKVFERVWIHVDKYDAAPAPTLKDAGWRKVLLAAALDGAIYAVVKAAVSRGGAAGVEKATGIWPGEVELEAA